MALTKEDLQIIDNKIDDCQKFTIEVVKDKLEHTQSSPQTLEAIHRIEKAMDKGFEKIEKKFENIEKKFASKWVETGVKGFIGTIMLYFLGGIMGLFSIAKASEMVNNYISYLH